MANSLRDQLLRAGLITSEQVEKANQPKPKPAEKPRGKSPGKPQTKPEKPKENKTKNPTPKPKSDLAQFYEARAQTEREERLQAEQQQRELAARRKQTREQVAQLLNSHSQNVDDADIRYNFVVGNNIKYLYVTAQQQQDLADGKLAITFQAGKRCLIPTEIGQQVLELDPSKIVIFNTPEMDSIPTTFTEPQP
ncbi:MAG: DUF2058 family protein [Candidatus Thiothrix moscowensis]|nr:DUF2058 family protein [Candidatus Thiothrix moscowensis]